VIATVAVIVTVAVVATVAAVARLRPQTDRLSTVKAMAMTGPIRTTSRRRCIAVTRGEDSTS
jgi:hypothetical protein